MLIWLRQLGTSGTEVINSVSADSLGNVYFSGYTDRGQNGSVDALLGKYDQRGNLLWLRQLGAERTEVSVSVSADRRGSVYFAGWTDGPLGGPYAGGVDGFVTKYDDAGNQQWVQQLGTSNVDSSTGVATDGFGNIYFAGYTDSSLAAPNAGQYDAFVAKISDVPEPAPFVLLGTFVAVVSATRFRRKS